MLDDVSGFHHGLGWRASHARVPHRHVQSENVEQFIIMTIMMYCYMCCFFQTGSMLLTKQRTQFCEQVRVHTHTQQNHRCSHIYTYT